MTMKTVILKINNPSRHKISVLDYSFKQYTLAYDYLLRVGKSKLENIQLECSFNGKLSINSLASYLSKQSTRLQHFPLHSSLKESLFVDVAGSLASYIELKKKDENTSYPTARQIKYRNEAYQKALVQLSLTTELEQENEARDELARTTKEQYMPMFFVRPDGIVKNRNFGFLYDSDKNKYYATLYLLPAESNRKKPMVGKDNLVAIHPNAKSLSQSTRPVPYLILPLAFGKWQEETYLKYALEHPKSVRTAFLSKKGKEYFLHVTFEFEAEKRETTTFLGIDRGINKFKKNSRAKSTKRFKIR